MVHACIKIKTNTEAKSLLYKNNKITKILTNNEITGLDLVVCNDPKWFILNF